MSTLTNRFKHNRLLPLALVFSTLVAGILIGTVISGPVDAARESEEPVTDATPLVVPSADPVENQFSELAQQVRPSVVSITVREVAADETQPRGYLERPEDFFRRFFGLPNQPNQPAPAPRRRGEGQGSGVIVDPKGYIITNAHVVRGAERIRVEFVGDGERYDAKLIGVDPETDLAVIHVDGKENLEAARIGNSDAANIGDWAIAIGSPFGYKETVTVGIISAKPREIGAEFQKFLQTDAAINPGNSGGPLLNIRGEVIGINTAIISRTGGYDGIGFALASNIAVETYNQIIRYGRVSRGSIGVSFRSDRNQSLIRSYGAEYGVFVQTVVDDGPAEDAGMQAEDIIVSVDGIKIDSGEKLIEVVAATSVGKTVPVEVFRSGKKVTLQVKVADRETLFHENAEVRIDAEQEDEQAVQFGIAVREITPDSRAEMKLDVSGGILVANVEANSFADDIGVLAGDVIVAVNRLEIGSIKELRDIQKQLRPGQDVSFKVLRWVGQEWNTRYPAGVVPE